jgi:hypothetical protein
MDPYPYPYRQHRLSSQINGCTFSNSPIIHANVPEYHQKSSRLRTCPSRCMVMIPPCYTIQPSYYCSGQTRRGASKVPLMWGFHSTVCRRVPKIPYLKLLPSINPLTGTLKISNFGGLLLAPSASPASQAARLRHPRPLSFPAMGNYSVPRHSSWTKRGLILMNLQAFSRQWHGFAFDYRRLAGDGSRIVYPKTKTRRITTLTMR